MRCPSCGNPESKVVDSRPSEDGTAIRRRRECLECGRRFTTYERLGDNPLIVIKADGSSEAYDRQKLMQRRGEAAHRARADCLAHRQHRSGAAQRLP